MSVGPVVRPPSSPVKSSEYGRIIPSHAAFVETSETDHEFVYKPILERLAPLEGQRVLDYGTGPGFLAKLMAERGAHVLGVDTSVEGVLAAEQRYPAAQFPRLSFRAIPSGDISAAKGQKFDAAVCSFVLCTLQDRGEVVGILKGIRDALKPGGTLVIADAPWDESNGANFVSYALPKAATPLQSGAPVTAILKGKNGHPDLPVQDYFWSKGDYRSMLEDSGFEVLSMDLPKAGANDTRWLDERKVPPSLIVTARSKAPDAFISAAKPRVEPPTQG
ncbi:MAG TPA: class I SAM-dependent methyltransferase [Myxococcaceae bacterium]|nr:class I SAM-dependent methyltransferase [Myxococcaceae bacterium]